MLDRDHKTQFEERILTDPSVYEELLVDEEELIDQYVAGELSALEQKQFESHFLITPERQKNLRFGKLLYKYATSQIDNILSVLSSKSSLTSLQTSPENILEMFGDLKS